MDTALVQATSVRDEALGILSRLGVPQSAPGSEKRLDQTSAMSRCFLIGDRGTVE